MDIDTRTAIKLALEHAIEDRMSFLDAMRNCTAPEDVLIKERTQLQIAAWRRVLQRRYGHRRTDHERALDNTKPIDIRDIKGEPE